MHMSDYLENKVLDWLLRGQSLTQPSNLYLGLCTGAPTDSANASEVAGSGYARVAIPCSLAAWAGTQGPGTTAASSGTSGASSNNGTIEFPEPSGSWGTITHFVLADASSGGNIWFWGTVTPNRAVSTGDDVTVAPGSLVITLAGPFTNYIKNHLIDYLLRGQVYSPPATHYVGLATDTPTAITPGTEPVGNAYARVAITASLANWAGTQSVGSTAVSSGTNGTTSNNGNITFPTPTGAGWGTLVSSEIHDAASAGNRLLYGNLNSSKSGTAGTAIAFTPSSLTFQLDN